jgi:hypothetical protein
LSASRNAHSGLYFSSNDLQAGIHQACKLLSRTRFNVFKSWVTLAIRTAHQTQSLPSAFTSKLTQIKAVVYSAPPHEPNPAAMITDNTNHVSQFSLSI